LIVEKTLTLKQFGQVEGISSIHVRKNPQSGKYFVADGAGNPIAKISHKLVENKSLDKVMRYCEDPEETDPKKKFFWMLSVKGESTPDVWSETL